MGPCVLDVFFMVNTDKADLLSNYLLSSYLCIKIEKGAINDNANQEPPWHLFDLFSVMFSTLFQSCWDNLLSSWIEQVL